MDLQPIRFIDEPISVEFDRPPTFEKRPPCPDGFTWRSETFCVVELLSEWRDYQRRGRMAVNMRPEHATLAAERGSWGVGRFYFRVRTAAGPIRSGLAPRTRPPVRSTCTCAWPQRAAACTRLLVTTVHGVRPRTSARAGAVATDALADRPNDPGSC